MLSRVAAMVAAATLATLIACGAQARAESAAARLPCNALCRSWMGLDKVDQADQQDGPAAPSADPPAAAAVAPGPRNTPGGGFKGVTAGKRTTGARRPRRPVAARAHPASPVDLHPALAGPAEGGTIASPDAAGETRQGVAPASAALVEGTPSPAAAGPSPSGAGDPAKASRSKAKRRPASTGADHPARLGRRPPPASPTVAGPVPSARPVATPPPAPAPASHTGSLTVDPVPGGGAAVPSPPAPEPSGETTATIPAGPPATPPQRAEEPRPAAPPRHPEPPVVATAPGHGAPDAAPSAPAPVAAAPDRLAPTAPAAGPSESAGLPAPAAPVATRPPAARLPPPDAPDDRAPPPPAGRDERAVRPAAWDETYRAAAGDLPVVAALLALETEALRTSETDAGFAACVGARMLDPAGTWSLEVGGADPPGAASAFAAAIGAACARQAGPATRADIPHPDLTLARFRALMADLRSPGAPVIEAVLRVQVAFRLQSDSHRFACIETGYLAGDTAAGRPFVFRLLMQSIETRADSGQSVASLVLASVRAYCADEQFAVRDRKS